MAACSEHCCPAKGISSFAGREVFCAEEEGRYRALQRSRPPFSLHVPSPLLSPTSGASCSSHSSPQSKFPAATTLPPSLLHLSSVLSAAQLSLQETGTGPRSDAILASSLTTESPQPEAGSPRLCLRRISSTPSARKPFLEPSQGSPSAHGRDGSGPGVTDHSAGRVRGGGKSDATRGERETPGLDLTLRLGRDCEQSMSLDGWQMRASDSCPAQGTAGPQQPEGMAVGGGLTVPLGSTTCKRKREGSVEMSGGVAWPATPPEAVLGLSEMKLAAGLGPSDHSMGLDSHELLGPEYAVNLMAQPCSLNSGARGPVKGPVPAPVGPTLSGATEEPLRSASEVQAILDSIQAHIGCREGMPMSVLLGGRAEGAGGQFIAKAGPAKGFRAGGQQQRKRDGARERTSPCTADMPVGQGGGLPAAEAGGGSCPTPLATSLPATLLQAQVAKLAAAKASMLSLLLQSCGVSIPTRAKHTQPSLDEAWGKRIKPLINLGHTAVQEPFLTADKPSDASHAENPASSAVFAPDSSHRPCLGGLHVSSLVQHGVNMSQWLPQSSQKIEGVATQKYILLYSCHVCGKEFSKPQALGGHMHCHRKLG